MKYTLLFILSLLLVPIFSHAQETPVPVALANLPTSPYYFLAPSEWTSPQAGVYIREDGALNSSYLLVLSYADNSIEAVLTNLLPSLQQTQVPKPAGQIESQWAVWTVYAMTYLLPENPNEVLIVDIAVTEREGTVYLLLLQTNPTDYTQFQKEVFQVAVESFGQSREALNAALGQGLLESITIPDFRLRTLIPRDWAEVNTGAYMRQSSPSDATTLLLQSSPDLSPIQFANLFLERLSLLLPSAYTEYDSPYLAWSIYVQDLDLPDSPVRLYLAIAQDREQSYLVSLLAPLSEAESLYTAYYLPILDAVQPLDE